MKELIRLYREADSAGNGGGNGSDAGAGAAFAIPDAYKDKPYLKGVDSPDKLFALLDGSQALIGKKHIPDDTSKPEEWEDFFKRVGRPDKPEAYAFDDKDLPADYKRDENFTNTMKAAMHKVGLSAKQAQALVKEFDNTIITMRKTHGEQTAAEKAAQDKAFDEITAKHFNTRKDEVLVNANKLLMEFTPKELQPYLNNLPNEQLTLMAAVLDGIRTKYIKEDGTPPGGVNGSGIGGTLAERTAEAQRLMTTDAYNNPFHPDHEATRKKISDLFAAERGKKV